MEQKEIERINSLKHYQILDTPSDGTYDNITQLAATIFSVPVAIISLVDEDRIWFKSKYGITHEEIGRDPGLCSSAILSDDFYLVEDARNDPRCLLNPLVAGDYGLQFYAAAPLKTRNGYNIGTFCILDKHKRFMAKEHQEILTQLAKIVMQEIELRLEANALAKDLGDRLTLAEKKLSELNR